MRSLRWLIVLLALFRSESCPATDPAPDLSAQSVPPDLLKVPLPMKFGTLAAVGVGKSFYVLVAPNSYYSYLQARNGDGEVFWNLDGVEAVKLVDRSGALYVFLRDGNLAKISPSGNIVWKRQFSAYDRRDTFMALGPADTVYIANRNLVALDRAGNVKWKFASMSAHPHPGIGPDGTVYGGGYDHGMLIAVTPEGKKKWSHSFLTSFFGGIGSPAVGADGTVYVSSLGTLYALRPDSSLRWKLRISGMLGQMVVTPGGTLLLDMVREEVSGIRAYSPQGLLQWVFPRPFNVLDRAILAAPDGRIFISKFPFTALNPDGTVRWRWRKQALAVPAPPGVLAWSGDGCAYLLQTPGADSESKP